jgi:hypothetical protein
MYIYVPKPRVFQIPTFLNPLGYSLYLDYLFFALATFMSMYLLPFTYIVEL